MRIKFWPRRLSTKLTLLNLLVFGGFALAVHLVTGQVFKQAISATVEQTAQQISKLLNLSLSLSSSTGDYAALRIFFDELLQDPDTSDIRYLVVMAPDNSILLGAGDYSEPVPAPSLSVPDTREDSVYHVRQPILLADNQVGAIQYGLDVGAPIAANVASRQKIAMLLLMGAAILSSIVALFAHRFSQNLNQLMDATEQIATGNYLHRVQLSSNDELSTLAVRFNAMAATIAQKMNDLILASNALEQLNQELEQRVEHRTQEIAIKNKVLEGTLQTLTETRNQLVEAEKLSGLGSLVAGVAHELNTPIGNAVMVGSGLLDEVKHFRRLYEAGIKRSELEHFLDSITQASDMIHRNLARAGDLVQSFKRVAVDQTSAQRREFLLDATVNELISTLSPSFRRRPIDIEVHVEPDILMSSYPGPLGQVLTNLINNALIHAFDEQTSGKITIAAHSDPEFPVLVEIAVTDNGKGMSEETQKRIFEPFYTTKLGSGGSGLGMNIVYSLVTGLLGGKIWVDSDLGKGSTITLKIPINAPARAESASP